MTTVSPKIFGKKQSPDTYSCPNYSARKTPKPSCAAKSADPYRKPHIRTSIRLSPEVDRYFRATGKGWQTRMNAVLKAWVAQHPQ